LAYCYYYAQDFTQAADCYEQLVQIAPEIDEYKFAFGQSLYRCGLNDEALRVLNQIDQPTMMNNVCLLNLLHFEIRFLIEFRYENFKQRFVTLKKMSNHVK
jgi:tetratricopeptide (TPR) repeat protein